MVGPFPWRVTGKVSYSEFLALALPSSNFRSTSSAAHQEVKDTSSVVYSNKTLTAFFAFPRASLFFKKKISIFPVISAYDPQAVNFYVH